MSYDPNYENDRKFGDKFLAIVKAIMGRILLTTDYMIEDMERNTDLIVLSMNSKRIGMRIRRYKYYEGYDDILGCFFRDEFTIRCSKESGAKTEFQKIMDGFGDYFFYGFANKNSDQLLAWVVIDLNAFRDFVLKSIWPSGGQDFYRDRTHTNPNGDKFLTFRIDEIPNGVVAISTQWERVTA